MYAFFNNVPEAGLDGNTGNARPFTEAPTKRKRQLAALDEQIAAAQRNWRPRTRRPMSCAGEVGTGQHDARDTVVRRWTLGTFTSKGGASLRKKVEDGLIIATGADPRKRSTL